VIIVKNIGTVIRVAVTGTNVIMVVIGVPGIISRESVEKFVISNVQETTREPVPAMPEALCCPSAAGWSRRWSVAHYG